MTIIFYDTETFCETPLAHCVHRYSETVEVMIETWAIDDGPVQIADRTAGEEGPWSMFDPEDFDVVVIHNSSFDRTVVCHALGVDIPVERIHDTLVQAMSHGLPGSLDKLCEIFRLGDLAKHKSGRQLIQLFCRPRPTNSNTRRATRHTHPIEWERFKDYAKADIPSMRALYAKIPKVNYPSPREHALWCLDQRMNDRGFLVDTGLAEAAIATVAKAKRTMDLRTQEMTNDGLRSTTQRDQLLRLVLAEYGVDLPDMQRATLERRVADESLPAGARELLAMRLQTSTTSNAKYQSLLRSVSSDGRLRGTMLFSGAARTKRWAGRTFQPQNLPRPDMSAEAIDDGISAMKAGACDLLFDEPIKVASNAIRGCIVAPEGKKLVVSDLAQVEARVLPWLAGEQWKLDAFAAFDRGEARDNYVMAYARGFGINPQDVSKSQRQIGKVSELSCGYGGAVGAWKAMGLLYGFELADAQVKEIVTAWRLAHPAICDWTTGFWALLDRAARDAIRLPGKAFAAGDHIRFERWREWLRMELPSGGFLNYAAPAIIADPRRPGADCVSYMGVNNYTRKWERLTTYGGKLSADATQSTAREIMADALPRIEAAGFELVLLCHDEAVT